MYMLYGIFGGVMVLVNLVMLIIFRSMPYEGTRKQKEVNTLELILSSWIALNLVWIVSSMFVIFYY